MPINAVMLVNRDSAEIKGNLRNLATIMPGEPLLVYDYAREVASKLGPTVNQALYMAFIVAISYVAKHNRSNEDLLLSRVPKIIKTVCDEEFAKTLLDFAEWLPYKGMH